jgi:hypothetical protein
MPSKNNGTMIDAFTNILATLTARDYHPTLNVMDNECSKAVVAHIQKNDTNIHLVPPHNQRVNAAERTIATFKEPASAQVGPHMAPTHITLAVPPSTIGVCVSSCPQHNNIVLPTLGASTPAIAPRQPSPPTT